MRHDEAMRALRSTIPVTDDEVSRRVGQGTLDVLREGITMTSTTEAPVTTPSTRRRRHLTRGAVAGLAALVLAGGGAAAWAAYSTRHESTSIDCMSPANDSIIPPVSGDPVADCTAMWRREGVTVPDGLRAYDNGKAIVVRIDGTVPTGSAPLPAGPVQDASAIELTASLADRVDGLAGQCRDARAATQFVRAELARLRLSDWTVRVDTKRPPTTGGCSYPLTNADTRTVTLIAGSPADAGDPDPAFVDALRARVSRACLPLAEAERVVRRAAAADGAADGMQLTALPDPTARCSRVDAIVGGAWMVTLHGPVAVGK